MKLTLNPGKWRGFLRESAALDESWWSEGADRELADRQQTRGCSVLDAKEQTVCRRQQPWPMLLAGSRDISF